MAGFTRSTGPVGRLVACASIAVMAWGCAGGKVMPIKTQAEFDAVVLRSRQPVLVDFYKGGCLTCILLDGDMDKLAEEYRGRAIIAKFELMTPVFVATSSELKKRYDISFFPTVLLFVNGQETRRWAIHYSLNDYRQALNEAIAATSRPPAGPP